MFYFLQQMFACHFLLENQLLSLAKDAFWEQSRESRCFLSFCLIMPHKCVPWRPRILIVRMFHPLYTPLQEVEIVAGKEVPNSEIFIIM